MKIISNIKGFFGKYLITTEYLDDPELQVAKHNFCKASAGKCYDKKNDTCKICSCICEVKVSSKVNVNIRTMKLEETHCPLGKHPIRLPNGEIGGNDLEIANYYRKQNGKAELK